MKPNLDRPRVVLPRYFWLALALLCLTQTWLVTQQWQQSGVVGSTDTDPWVRLVRVEHLLASGDWYDRTIQQLNPPQGMQSHWTRPLDVVLVVASLPFMLFMSVKSALFLSAVWLNTLWVFLSAFALVWALRPLSLGIAAQVVIAFGFVMDPLLTMVYAPGRAADHHSLLALLGIVLFGLCVHTAHGLLGKRAMLVAGGLAALGLWIAPEFLALIALVYAGFGLWWVKGKSEALQHLSWFSRSLMVKLLMVLFVERGLADLLAIQHDRLSVVHVALACMVYGGVEALRRLPYASWKGRLVAAGVMGGLVLVAMQLLFPGFYLGPMAAMEPALRQAFNDNVNELRSAFDSGRPMLTVSFYDALILTFLIALLRAKRVPAERGIWLVVLGIIAMFGVLMTYQLRWNYYLLPYGLIGLAVCADAAATFMAQRLPAIRGMLSVMVALLVASSCIWPALIMPATPVATSQYHAPAYTTACSKQLRRMIQHGEVQRIIGDAPVVVLTAPYIAPQLIYYTPYKAIASFYHNLMEGMFDLNRFFYVPDDATAKRIIDKWQVRYLLFCADDIAKPYAGTQDVLPFIDALQAGNLPGWLTRVDGKYDPMLQFFKIE